MVTAKELIMKNLMIVCLVAFTLGSFVGCSSDKTSASTQSASLQTDTKAVKK
jgi:uncharacterized protein YcfL